MSANKNITCIIFKQTLFIDNNHNATFVGQVAAKESCLKQNSILRRYTNNKDICELGGSQHWTSGERSVQQYIVQYTGIAV